eukprot:CAMPEP_0176195634 /NCGR_PEP_ID=MMETSP0121_2-20121125/6614_1 /TAXON_ID=160619 /ORGANISM="Kryptoperidinium foliaceum, Strain CCMP 1326" /LENGTH=694 /DNA_ID=CAMNT_0017534411 /DNA_START=33 /DNA_END=2117 /DNA_ORIENTATION=-
MRGQFPCLALITLGIIAVQLGNTLWTLNPCRPLAGLVWQGEDSAQITDGRLPADDAAQTDVAGAMAQTGVAVDKAQVPPAPALPAAATPADSGSDGLPPVVHVAPYASLARVTVINVASATNRWEHMQKTMGPLFASNDLPPMQRHEALTPEHDNCELPYSMSDCCTLSHSTAVKNFADDASVREDQWALILEDDIALHPDIARERFPEILRLALRTASDLMSPFVYFGICAPSCKGQERTLVTESGAKATLHLHCGGTCTHAYAVQKFIAPHIPTFLRRFEEKTATIDQAFRRMSTALNMSLLGSSLQSRDARARNTDHRGIFYMTAFGDSLTASTAWDERVKVRFRLKTWTGRLGNLMFQWAVVVALAAQAGVETHAYFYHRGWSDSAECPAHDFWKKFRLQRFSRDVADMEHNGNPNCWISFYEKGPNRFDKQGVSKLLSSIERIKKKSAALPMGTPERCRMIDVGVEEGYFQSWKYFDAHKGIIIKAFSPQPQAAAKAREFFLKKRAALDRQYNESEWIFVGVQVRRGDKVHEDAFNKIYFNCNWAYFREGMRYLEKTLKASSGPKARVAFVVTAGGTLGRGGQDIKEARAALSNTSEVVLFSESQDPMLDYAILVASSGVVISAGSFGWWAAYMCNARAPRPGTSNVVVPKWLYRETAKQFWAGYSVGDYYPPGWKVLLNNFTDGQSPQ